MEQYLNINEPFSDKTKFTYLKPFKKKNTIMFFTTDKTSSEGTNNLHISKFGIEYESITLTSFIIRLHCGANDSRDFCFIKICGY